MPDGDTRLLLFPLPDVVHFPRTELRLHILEPRYRRLVRDVSAMDEESRWIGVVTIKPGPRLDAEGRPEVFPGGTAARVLDIEEQPDGSHVVLHGEFRFELQRELDEPPHRQALVRPVEEPWLNERDAGIVAVRKRVLDLLRSLSAELGESFPLSGEDIDELADCFFEELINRIAAGVDVPPLRKLQLLTEPLPERGLSVLSILRSRRQVMDLLRPFRRLADGSELN